MTAPHATLPARPRRVIVLGLDDDALATLREAAPSLELLGAPDLSRARAWIDDAEAILGWITPEVVRRGRALRWVHLFAAGVERFCTPELAAAPIVVTCERGIHGAAVADHAMALLLGLTRGLAPALRPQAARTWNREPPPRLLELAGRRAVIVGFGGIGQAIAARARAFGLRIVAVAREARPAPEGVDRVVGRRDLEEALDGAEVLFLAAPLTEETQGRIDDAALARLARGALVINVGRGGLVDHDALTRALSSGHLGGAGLDVTHPEPLPEDHPLWSREDVLLTPHVAGLSDRVMARRLELAADNLRRFAAGEALRGVVDPRVGG
ncbi:MAG: D-2-hydroxyacid dehydrogenase [Nannocystaceae bacterium]